MEGKSVKEFHPFRDLSLKWSFVIYVAVCILAALLISLSLSGLFSHLQNNIEQYYLDLYRDEIAKQAYLISDGELAAEEGLLFYTQDIRQWLSDRDSLLYDLYGLLAVLVVPITSLVCVIIVGVLFYLRKLKKPLAILDFASMRIAAGDLDFKVEYDSRNEFGRLVSSFETMRKSLLETNREMWQMMEERRRLNAAFAHDLRTPLTVLRGYCDYLLKYIPQGKVSNDKVISTLSTIDVYLKRLEGYTATMSSLQKLDELELAPKEVGFDSLCDELKNTSELLASEKRIEFHRKGDGVLYLDPSAVLQTYENLISNAVRYAQAAVTVNCVLQDGYLSIIVADDGPGFTAEALKKATEPYFRTDKDLADSTHFGIGLYICRLLCEKHSGSLSIQNATGGKVTASFKILNEE